MWHERPKSDAAVSGTCPRSPAGASCARQPDPRKAQRLPGERLASGSDQESRGGGQTPQHSVEDAPQQPRPELRQERQPARDDRLRESVRPCMRRPGVVASPSTAMTSPGNLRSPTATRSSIPVQQPPPRERAVHPPDSAGHATTPQPGGRARRAHDRRGQQGGVDGQLPSRPVTPPRPAGRARFRVRPAGTPRSSRRSRKASVARIAAARALRRSHAVEARRSALAGGRRSLRVCRFVAARLRRDWRFARLHLLPPWGRARAPSPAARRDGARISTSCASRLGLLGRGLHALRDSEQSRVKRRRMVTSTSRPSSTASAAARRASAARANLGLDPRARRAPCRHPSHFELDSRERVAGEPVRSPMATIQLMPCRSGSGRRSARTRRSLRRGRRTPASARTTPVSR